MFRTAFKFWVWLINLF